VSAGGETRRLVVLGTLASNPYSGMAWMHGQITAGLLRLGHDVHYLETSSTWPYDPVRQEKVCDSDYAVPYLGRIAREFGFGDRWAYRRSYSDKAWLGPAAGVAEQLLAEADATLSIVGCTRLAEEGLEVGRLVFVDTDPLWPQVRYAQGDPDVRSLVDEHDEVITYGENIGRDGSPVPPLPNTRGWMRQPVLLDMWATSEPPRDVYTTVANWKQGGRDLVFDGELYGWSKDVEFLKMLELPQRVAVPVELATNLSATEKQEVPEGEQVPAWGAGSARDLLVAHGWRVVDASFTADPFVYREYVRASRAEFSVARDMHVRLRSGWFSERDACYLAAGRPVVAQDTGFGDVLPTGEGLLAWTTLDEAVAAIEEVESDYARHARAARELAQEYFAAEKVLSKMLEDLGL
jgi:hypothetical protein